MKYDYDETGAIFSYFVLTLLGIFLLPTTYHFWKLFFASKDIEGDASKWKYYTSSEPCKRKKAKLVKKYRESRKLGKLFVAWIAAIVLFGYFCYVVATTEIIEDEAYDPYKILDLPYTATEAEIKKQFRSLSIKYHPDKAEDPTDAEEKFIAISKAYQSLTDEDIRKNWEEYGNPDGQKKFSLGIALPSWIVSSSNMAKVLLFYGVIVGIGLPFMVNRWWQNARKYTRDKILNSTMEIYYQELKETMNFHKILEILSASVEFKEGLPNRPEDIETLPKLIAAITSHVQSNKMTSIEKPKKYVAPYCIKAFYLLHAHLLRVPVEDAGLQRDLEFVIENSLHLVLGQLQISLARGWLITSVSCMNVCQMIVQAVYDTGYEQQFLQLPHLNLEILKHFRKKGIRNITEFLAMLDADRRSLLRTLEPEAVEDVVRIAQSIPVVKIAKAEFVTLGESKVIAGGLVTLIVKLEVESGTGALSPTASPTTQDRINFSDLASTSSAANLNEDGGIIDEEDIFDEDNHVRIAPKGPKSNPNDAIYAPYLGTLDKKPFWWVVLAEPRMNNFICPPVKIHDLVTSKVIKMQFVAPSREGTYQFVLYLKSDSYLGVDLRQDVKMQVAARTEASAIQDDLDDISEDEGPLAMMQRELKEAQSQGKKSKSGEDGGVGMGL